MQKRGQSGLWRTVIVLALTLIVLIVFAAVLWRIFDVSGP